VEPVGYLEKEIADRRLLVRRVIPAPHSVLEPVGYLEKEIADQRLLSHAEISAPKHRPGCRLKERAAPERTSLR
jgi:hypothetical protein